MGNCVQKTRSFFKNSCSCCCLCAKAEPDSFDECYTRTGVCTNNRFRNNNTLNKASDEEQYYSAHETFPQPDANQEVEPELAILPATMIASQERQAARVAN